jgi:2-polyprenyl-3-methyl-5-hydroxy-6-metoxy-1,4-benzoquinol methylase
VGCARGVNADALRGRGASVLNGIDNDPEFAAEARQRYDEVVLGSVPDHLGWEAGSYDTVLAYDVLEHLFDPWETTRRLAQLLRPGGRLHISVPNARSKALWGPLLMRGTFAYAPEGIMDVTHVRFFTRRDAVAMAEAAGLEVERVDHPPAETGKRRVAYRVGLTEFLTIQWFVLAAKPS